MFLFYINNNRDRFYTLKDLEDGKLVVFDDDLVWHENIDKWEYACNVSEINLFLRKRPPLSVSTKKLLFFKKSAIRYFLFYCIFSVLVGITAGLLEFSQFTAFQSEIETCTIKNNKERRKEAEKKKELERKIKLEQEQILQSRIIARDERLAVHRENIAKVFDEWKKAEDEWLYVEQSDVDNFKNQIKILNDQTANIGRLEHDETVFGLYTPVPSDQIPNTINAAIYDIPNNELYVQNNGEDYTRWVTYVPHNFKLNEGNSYLSRHRYFLRPYYAIFSVANLSYEEQQNLAFLIYNFVHSSLNTHLPILLVLLLLAYFKSRKIFDSRIVS